MSVPALSILIVIPLFGALVARFIADLYSARRVAVIAGSAVLLLSLGLTIALHLHAFGGPLLELTPDLGPLGARPLLGLDGLNAPLVVLTAFLAVAVLIAAPRVFLDRAVVMAVLLMTSAILGLLLTRSIVLLGIFWLLAALPGLWRINRLRDDQTRRLLRRTYGLLFVGGSAPLLVAVYLIVRVGMRAGVAAPADIVELVAAGVPPAEQPLIFGLFMATIVTRMAVFPMHSWFPIFAERGPVGVTVLIIGVHIGLYATARVVIPLLPEACAGGGMQVVVVLGVASALLGSVLALVQDNLRRMIGTLGITQEGFLMIGMASLNHAGIAGALLQSIGSGLAISALFLMSRAIEARTGTADVRYLGGLVARAPRAAAMFLLFGMAAVGFPGSVGFVGEDLLVHGALHSHPVAACLVLLATALAGIAFFRAFKRTFLGRAARRPRTAGPLPIEDLLLRERVVMLALALTLILGGLWPQPVIDERDEIVTGLVATIERAVHTGQRPIAAH